MKRPRKIQFNVHTNSKFFVCISVYANYMEWCGLKVCIFQPCALIMNWRWYISIYWKLGKCTLRMFYSLVLILLCGALDNWELFCGGTVCLWNLQSYFKGILEKQNESNTLNIWLLRLKLFKSSFFIALGTSTVFLDIEERNVD